MQPLTLWGSKSQVRKLTKEVESQSPRRSNLHPPRRNCLKIHHPAKSLDYQILQVKVNIHRLVWKWLLNILQLFSREPKRYQPFDILLGAWDGRGTCRTRPIFARGWLVWTCKFFSYHNTIYSISTRMDRTTFDFRQKSSNIKIIISRKIIKWNIFRTARWFQDLWTRWRPTSKALE